MTILGAILAGGRSTRFGSDKALAQFHGRPLLDHVARALTPHVDRIVLCGRRHDGYEAIADRPLADLGPLGGLNAALRFARDQGLTTVCAVPCDTPVLDPGLIAALVAGPGPAYLRESPVIGVWPADLADRLDRFLADGDDRSLRAWCRAAGARALDLAAPVNVNRPVDLARLQDSGAELGDGARG